MIDMAGKKVLGYGNTRARIILVGEAPGAEEEKQGKPFVGRSGKLLNKALEKAGIRREDLFITNVVKLRPPGNKKPKSSEVRECRPVLLREIEAIEPEVVCLLGSTAIECLLGKYPVTKYRGKIIEKDGSRFLVTFHPAAVLRNPNRMGDFVSDIRKLKKFL